MALTGRRRHFAATLSINVQLMNCAKLLSLTALLSAYSGLAVADEFGQPDSAARKASCHLVADGSISCIRISGYLSAGQRFVGAAQVPSPFAPRESGFTTTHLSQEPELGAALGSTRVYLDGDDPSR